MTLLVQERDVPRRLGNTEHFGEPMTGLPGERRLQALEEGALGKDLIDALADDAPGSTPDHLRRFAARKGVNALCIHDPYGEGEGLEQDAEELHVPLHLW